MPTPIPACSMPSSLNATPRITPSSRKVPSWLFMKRRLGVESQATKMSGHPSRRPGFPEPGVLGYICKRAIAVVTVEPVLAVVGAEDVIESVIVVIGHADSIGPTHGSETGFFGYIRESSVAIVFIKPIGR